MKRIISIIALSLFASTLAPAQAPSVVEAYLPSNTPASGLPTTSALGNAVIGGETQVQRIPASQLTQAGLAAGAVLTEIAVAPAIGGMYTANSFTAAVGLVPGTWDGTQLLGNLAAPEFLWDSATSAPFNWTLTARTWNNLNQLPLGATAWDAVRALALYIRADSATFTPSGPNVPPLPPGVFFPPLFSSADGLSDRNAGTGFNATTVAFNDSDGLRLRMRFIPQPPIVPGTVTFLGANVLTPGNTLTVRFDAPNHAGEAFLPFVACNSTPSNGITGAPVSAVTPDSCTSFYFNDPRSPFIFALASPRVGPTFGFLDSTGQSTGFITAPTALVPPGLNISVWVTFVTINGTTVTAAHGTGMFSFN